LFDGFAKGLNGSGRIVFGDLTKGGREASPASLESCAAHGKTACLEG
jgi:hypothetical protein